MAMSTVVSERRNAPRATVLARVEIDAQHLPGRLEARAVNLSEGGVCVRLQLGLDISSQVTMRLFAERQQKPLECAGRVAWVVQRLDLRSEPPFLYDVGVEFVNPSVRLQQFAARFGVELKMVPRPVESSAAFQATMINDRSYVPTLAHEALPVPCWHLVVSVDGAPCLSQRYPTAKQAAEAWKQFKTRMASASRRPTGTAGKGSRREGRR